MSKSEYSAPSYGPCTRQAMSRTSQKHPLFTQDPFPFVEARRILEALILMAESVSIRRQTK